MRLGYNYSDGVIGHSISENTGQLCFEVPHRRRHGQDHAVPSAQKVISNLRVQWRFPGAQEHGTSESKSGHPNNNPGQGVLRRKRKVDDSTDFQWLSHQEL